MEPTTFSRNGFGIATCRRRHRGGHRGQPSRSLAAKRDYFREMGIRPFINAAGTYTAMTSSLMPPEVMDAIQYASEHYVMLDELHNRVGERIADARAG